MYCRPVPVCSWEPEEERIRGAQLAPGTRIQGSAELMDKTGEMLKRERNCVRQM